MFQVTPLVQALVGLTTSTLSGVVGWLVTLANSVAWWICEPLGSLLFDWSMAEFVERYLLDERLQIAYLGQGVIGTNASPFDAGTASIRFHHASGRLGGLPGMWGYVRGGMGMVSFYFCDAAC